MLRGTCAPGTHHRPGDDHERINRDPAALRRDIRIDVDLVHLAGRMFFKITGAIAEFEGR